VVVCTRNRPQRLARALSALDRQQDREFCVIVVDQSDSPDPALARREAADSSFRVIRDTGRGLSRARNLATAAASSDWLAFIDDDCLLDPNWTQELTAAIKRNPGVDFISGHVGDDTSSHRDEFPIATITVRREMRLSGRRPPAAAMGFGVCMAVRRSTAERLRGWDERLGAGAPDFPAAEDIDFNHRFLRSGGVALVTPRLRALHEQWRSPDELAQLLLGYMTADGGLAAKHLKAGDVVGALRLWSSSALFLARMAGGGLRRRSPLRLRLAAYQLRGLARGTVKGLARRW
jgi:glycosyltransferase involved in cell wall biosynthesis